MGEEICARLKSFSLSLIEHQRVELSEGDVQIGVEEGNRRLIGKVFGVKKVNFLGVKSSLMKLWQHRGLCKVVNLAVNTFQFIFNEEKNRADILQGRPWFFDNHLLVLHPWRENLSWEDNCFNVSPLWVQVWQIHPHWLSIDTGRKIGKLLGHVRDVLVVDKGGQDNRHIKILVDIDLTQPLARGTKLKYKDTEIWIKFKYEQIPVFCYYCGCVGHSERVCELRKEDTENNCLREFHFGSWMRAANGRAVSGGNLEGQTTMARLDTQKLEAHQRTNTRDNSDTPSGDTSGQLKESYPGNVERLTQGISKAPQRLDDSGDHSNQIMQRSEPKPNISSVTARDTPKPLATEENRETCSVSLDQQTSMWPEDTLMLELPTTIEQEGTADTSKIELDRQRKGGSTVQQREQRVPLQDYTNISHPSHQANQQNHSGQSKGQWKRRARLKGQMGTDQPMEPKVSSEEVYRKRWRDHSDLDSDTDPDIGRLSEIVKKGKKAVAASCITDSEVEETSRDWSQSIR